LKSRLQFNKRLKDYKKKIETKYHLIGTQEYKTTEVKKIQIAALNVGRKKKKDLLDEFD
jgi:hypothetical protein